MPCARGGGLFVGERGGGGALVLCSNYSVIRQQIKGTMYHFRFRGFHSSWALGDFHTYIYAPTTTPTPIASSASALGVGGRGKSSWHPKVLYGYGYRCGYGATAVRIFQGNFKTTSGLLASGGITVPFP